MQAGSNSRLPGLPLLWLSLLGAAFYLLFLGSVHLFDWDEINFAESSREMLVTGDYFRVTVDYQPFWEKPPFFFWLQVASMRLFGINEFAARFPNAICGILSLLTVFAIGRRVRNEAFAWTWSLTYFGAFLPFLYFKSGIIDPVFNYFIFCSLYCFIRSVQAETSHARSWWMLAAGLVNGMAVLTKGPVGLLLVLLTVGITWASFRFRKLFRISDLLLFPLGVILSSSLWYLPELINHGPWFFREFIRYQVELFTQPVAGHAQPFYYHFVVVFIGCFPMSVYALPSLWKPSGEDEKMAFGRWMVVLFWVVMILFSIVRTKIVHYSSMAYLPLSYLAADYLYAVYMGRRRMKKGMLILAGCMGILFATLILALPLILYNKTLLYPYIRDPFALASLQRPVAWTGWEWIFGLVFLGAWAAVWRLMHRGNILRAITLYGLAMALVLTAYLKMVIPRIEQYSQAPAIRFYESIRGQDVYVTTVGFKSYAHLFYFRQPLLPDHVHRTDKNWLIDGNIDKPAYFVTKNTEKYLKGYPKVQKIGEEGGFIFYRRMPDAPQP